MFSGFHSDSEHIVLPRVHASHSAKRVLTTDWTLVRLHHGRRGRRGNYSESELDEWARRIAEWRRRAEVLVYFNNDWEGFAVRNGLSLMRRLQPSRAGSARA